MSGVRTIVIAIGGVVFLFPFVWMVSTSLTTTGELFKLPPQAHPNPVGASAYERLFYGCADRTAGSPAAWASRLGDGAAGADQRDGGLTRSPALPSAGATSSSSSSSRRSWCRSRSWSCPCSSSCATSGMLDSYTGLIIPEMAMPFGVFLLRQAFLGLPRELEEAAFVDGADHLRVFFTLVLPLSKPTIATVAVFSLHGLVEQPLWPLVIINSPDLMTLPLGLSSLSSHFVTDWNLLLAGATISVLPIVAVFLFAQRYVLKALQCPVSKAETGSPLERKTMHASPPRRDCARSHRNHGHRGRGRRTGGLLRTGCRRRPRDPRVLQLHRRRGSRGSAPAHHRRLRGAEPEHHHRGAERRRTRTTSRRAEDADLPATRHPTPSSSTTRTSCRSPHPVRCSTSRLRRPTWWTRAIYFPKAYDAFNYDWRAARPPRELLRGRADLQQGSVRRGRARLPRPPTGPGRTRRPLLRS